jgi:hypothetical protein
MRVSDLTRTLADHGWQIEEQTKEYVYVRPRLGVERGLLFAYLVIFTGFVLAGLQLAADANLDNISVNDFIIRIQNGSIDNIIREDGEYIITLNDGTRERYLDPAGTLYIRFEQAGLSEETIDALPVEVRGDGNDIRLFERMLIGVVPLVVALSLLFIGGLWLLARLSSRRAHVFKLDEDRRTILMEDRRGTWELDSREEFETVARQRNGVAMRTILIIWLIASLLWFSGVILVSTLVAGSA